MRKLSLAALTALDLAPDALIGAAEAAGFDCVGIRLIPATTTEKDYGIIRDAALQQACVDRLAGSRVKVEDIEILRIVPGVDIAAFEPVLALGKKLGARSALVAADDADENRLTDNLFKLAELSERYDILPHVEFMPWLQTSDLRRGVELVNRVGHKNLSVLIDTIHFDRSHSKKEDWTLYHGTKPRYLQVCDTPTPTVSGMDEVLAQARSDRRIPGEGYIEDMADIVRLTDNSVALSLEIPGAGLPADLPVQERINTIYARTKAWAGLNGL